ncbi:MAG TPA: hypothetical protein VLM11_05865 [Streptosporangiaceae bacterium]|nr:hypothetical protein [Streptosporangiaceae bacterium]
MRNPPGDGADQRSTRRRDPVSGRHSQPGRPQAGGAVFAPAYDPSRPEPPGEGAPQRASNPGMSLYGSPAGGVAGKGPVRGYPPVPGQPPPMYPPGQFAAWNRRLPGQGRAGEMGPDQQARLSGPHTGPGAIGAARRGPDPLVNGYPGSAGAWGDDGTPRARYYQDLESGAEPGYSTLAVSDPAADVTSTQTWHAVAEGRATGVWTAPAGHDRDLAGSPGRGSDTTALPRRARGLDPADRGTADPDKADLDTTGSDAARAGEQGRRGSRGHSGTHTSPSAPGAQRRGAKPAGSGDARRPGRPRPRRKRAGSVRLATVTAVVLVVAAAAALLYAVLHHSANPNLASSGARKSTGSPSVSASPTPSLGRYGHIATRTSDPALLTMRELYPTSFIAGGTTVVETASSKGTNCVAELVGSRIQSAIGSAGCTQVVRATYLASGPGVMGTIGVLNLSTAKAATTVAHAADANDFISQLAGQHGATTKIGQGTGIEEAAAKGHYLILIWAEFTNLRKPRTPAQLKTVEQFMSELLQNTANVSLTNRMLTGTP